ncbi:MAG: hypothetical protein TU36_007825 [Vulcanisaeta sp. AZ3]|nr:MAG: hypothetical protein TU36_07290 [Vulcanisaeta sp. AZ3]
MSLEQHKELCQICEERPASYTCRICSRHVCEEDFDFKVNACKACSSTLCQVCHERLAISHCARCGKLVCRKDSIRVGLSRYCLDCARELRIIDKV